MPQRFLAPQSDGRLDRSVLADGILAVPERSVLLLEAPAGYGKTSLLAQWRETALRDRLQVAWLTLQTAQRTAAGFIRSVVDALNTTGIKCLPKPLAETSSAPPEALERYAEALMLAVEANPCRVFLMVDDYHVAATECADRVLGLLVATMPRNLVIALATRHFCRAPLARILLEGRLHRVSSRALRFSRAETRAFFGSGLSAEELHVLQATTEGWPAGVRMAQICQPAWRKTHEDPRNAPEFTRLIAEYCRSELLRTVSPEELRLLTDASIVDTFGARLCDALGEREDSARVLAELVARETFVEPVDKEPGIYRIPFLLRQYLQQRGHERGPRELAARHTRAARFLETHSDTLAALHHHLAAGNPAAAAECLERANPLHLAVNRGDELAMAHLELISAPELVKFPRLALCRAYLDYKQGLLDHARHMMDVVALHTDNFKTDRAGGDDRQFAIEVSYVEIIREMFGSSSVSSEYLARVERKAGALQEDPTLAAVCTRSIGMLHALRGNLDAAERHFFTGERLMVHDRAPWGTFWLKYHLAALALARGKLMDVRYHLQAGLKLWRSTFKTHAPYGALSRLLLAELDYEADVLTEAQTKLDESLFTVENAGGWFDSFAGAYELAVMLQAQANRFNEVESLIARASTDQRIGSLLAGFLEALRLRCYLLWGRFDAAEALVTRCQFRERWQSPHRDDELSYRERDLIGLCLARLAIESGRYSDAAALLSQLEIDVSRGGRRRAAAKVALHQAAMLHRQGDSAGGFARMKQALEHGHAQGYRRTFLDEAPLVQPLLAWALAQDRDVLPEYLHGYVQSLLRALSPQPPEDSATAPLLSTREQEVLHELRLGNANKIIARKFNVSEATVKFHVKNIFRKLKVRKRAAAVAEAHRHGLIT